MNTEILEHIEAYLDGQITLYELEQKANTLGVEDLKEKIQWYRDSRTAIEAAGLREQLSGVIADAGKKEARRVPLYRQQWFKLAAAASVLLVALFYFLLPRSEEQDLYASYEFVDPGLPVLMSQSEDHLLYDAMTYYGEADYPTTIEKLQALQEQFPQNDTINYYLGASMLYSGKTADANNTLTRIAEDQSSGFQERGEWLLVLSALKAGDTNQVKGLLSDITADSNHNFYDQAVQLQEELTQ